jgi:hypothetical protein
VDISGQVVSVLGRNVNTKFGVRTVYDITFSGGQVAAVWNDKDGLATKAKQLETQGIAVDARLEHKQSAGNDGTVYDNYTLLDIAPSGQLLPAASTALGITGPPLNGQTSQIPIVPSGGMSPERESKIVKQSCLATAFNFVGHVWAGTQNEEGIVEFAFDLAKRLYAEVYGQENVAQTPQTVAAAVNDVVPEAVKVGAPEW